MSTSNRFEHRAREIKVAKLVAVLRTMSTDADTVAALPATGRRMAEELASVKLASDTTWAAVVAQLRFEAKFGAKVSA